RGPSLSSAERSYDLPFQVLITPRPLAHVAGRAPGSPWRRSCLTPAEHSPRVPVALPHLAPRSRRAHDAPHLLEPADGIPDGAEYTGGRNRLEGPVPKWEGFGGCPDEPHPAADLLPPAPGAHQHPRRNVHGRELHAFAVQREVAAGADSDLEGPAARSCDHTATTRLAAHRLHRRRKPVVERRDAVVDWCHGKINRPQKNHRTSPSRRLPRRAYAVPRPPTNP